MFLTEERISQGQGTTEIDSFNRTVCVCVGSLDVLGFYI